MYNAEKFIIKLLDSIYHQDNFNLSFELILIDDCSPDNSVGIANQYIKDNQIFNLKLITNQQNSGTASSRNRGIEVAEGEYIQFVDSDDYLQANYFELIHNQLQSKKDCYIYGISYEYQQKNIIHTPVDCTDRRMIGYKNSVCNKVYRAEIIHQFNPKFSFEDVIWLVEVINNDDLSCDQIAGLYYHVNRTNVDSKMANLKQDEWYKMARATIKDAKKFNRSSRAFVLETFVGTLFAKAFKRTNRIIVAIVAITFHFRYLPFVIKKGIRSLDKRTVELHK